MIRRLLVPLLAALGLMVAPAAAAAAKINVAVGIGDQSARMFADPSYKALNLKKTRYFIHWDAISKQGELDKADAFVNAANAAGVEVLMHLSTNNLTARQAALPSVAQYKSAARALIARYRPMGVRVWGVWNEANHNTQPTFKSPKRAAQFYKTFRRLCTRCRIVALDILDQRGVEDYVAKWFAAAGSVGRRATIFGIHNYSQVNRRITDRRATNRYPGTARIIKAVRRRSTRAKFWFTETGGIVNFGSFTCSNSRAASRTKFMFGLLKTYDRNVDRLYSYNWFGAGCNGFDAGLVEADGTRRPAYAVFRSQLKNARR